MSRDTDAAPGGPPSNDALAVAVRRATALDVEAMAALEAASFALPWSGAALAASLAGTDALGLIAVTPGAGSAPDDAAAACERAILGYALFRRVLDEAELLRVAVAPAARRHGIARRLVGRGLGELAGGGVLVCHLEVRAGNAPAIALYEALGFTLAGRRPGYYSGGETALLFTQPLAGFVDRPGGGCYPAAGPPKGGANDAGS